MGIRQLIRYNRPRYRRRVIMEKATFGKRLRALRTSRDWSQRTLAYKYGQLLGKEEGVATSVIAAWESDKRKPSRTVIAQLATALRATDSEHESMLLAAGFVPEDDQVISKYRGLRLTSSRRKLAKLLDELVKEEEARPDEFESE